MGLLSLVRLFYDHWVEHGLDDDLARVDGEMTVAHTCGFSIWSATDDVAVFEGQLSDYCDQGV